MASFLAGGASISPQVVKDFFNDDEGSAHEDNINRRSSRGSPRAVTLSNTQFCPEDPVFTGSIANFLYRGQSDF